MQMNFFRALLSKREGSSDWTKTKGYSYSAAKTNAVSLFCCTVKFCSGVMLVLNIWEPAGLVESMNKRVPRVEWCRILLC